MSGQKNMSKFDDTTLNVIRWAEARQIIPNSTPEAQILKTVEELGELVSGIVKKRPLDIADAFGDVLVTLTLAAALLDVDLAECFANAYEEIKDRKGHMTKEGVFVKDEA